EPFRLLCGECGLGGRVSGVRVAGGLGGGRRLARGVRVLGAVAEGDERPRDGPGGAERDHRHEHLVPGSHAVTASGRRPARPSEAESCPSPPVWPARRVSQPCLFIVTKAKSLIGRATRITVSVMSGSSSRSRGCWRKCEKPRTPRPTTTHATASAAPITVYSRREKIR